MWVTCTGCVLILFCAFLLGNYYGDQLNRRLKQLKQIYLSMQMLKGEISYQHAALSEAFVQAGNRCDGCIGRFLTSVGEGLNKRQSSRFVEVWEPSVSKLYKESALTKEDMELLREFGKHLGYLNLSMQENRILFFMEQLMDTISALDQVIVERKRLYRVLGLLGGGFLVIILI